MYHIHLIFCSKGSYRGRLDHPLDSELGGVDDHDHSLAEHDNGELQACEILLPRLKDSNVVDTPRSTNSKGLSCKKNNLGRDHY